MQGSTGVVGMTSSLLQLNHLASTFVNRQSGFVRSKKLDLEQNLTFFDRAEIASCRNISKALLLEEVGRRSYIDPPISVSLTSKLPGRERRSFVRAVGCRQEPLALAHTSPPACKQPHDIIFNPAIRPQTNRQNRPKHTAAFR